MKKYASVIFIIAFILLLCSCQAKTDVTSDFTYDIRLSTGDKMGLSVDPSSDFSRISELMPYLYENDYDCNSDDALQIAEITAMTRTFYNYADNKSIALEAGEDPRNIFNNDILGCLKIDGDFLDDVLIKIFNVKPDHNFEPVMDGSVFAYYDSGYYYVDGYEGGSAPTFEIIDSVYDENGVYTLLFSSSFEDEILGNYLVKAKPIFYNNLNDWSILSISKTENSEIG